MIKQRLELFIVSLMSRKFVVAVIGFVFTALNYILGWGLTETQIGLILAPLASYILAEGAADVAGRATGHAPSAAVTTVATPVDDPEAPDPAGGIVTGVHRIKTFDEKSDDEQA